MDKGLRQGVLSMETFLGNVSIRTSHHGTPAMDSLPEEPFVITIDAPAERNLLQPPRPCPHQPRCPSAEAPNRDAARIHATHPEQGWSLLCNGVIVFDDTGELLPDGRAVVPWRARDLVAI